MNMKETETHKDHWLIHC